MTRANPGLLWRKTNAPTVSSRTDDIWFATPQLGWAVNGNGQILRTDDGGDSWVVQLQDTDVYFRCIGFSGENIGWAGSLTGEKRLFHTTDGGANWAGVDNLPALPVKICGVSVVNENVVYASGTNEPRDTPAVLKTVDGGATWTSIDMRAHASLLVDIRFITPERGWVVGGRDAFACPGRPPSRDLVRPVVLFTEDGGASWTNLIRAGDARSFPIGEWGWKIFFVNANVAYVSLENFLDGAILKSTDGGRTWRRMRINDSQRNSNLEGVGFITEDVGWVGGWGDVNFTGGFTSQTQDGGEDWEDANEVGFRLNRFRFFGDPVTTGYASGDTVYKYSTQPVTPAPALAMAAAPALLKTFDPLVASAGPTDVTVAVPEGARSLKASLWDRFGNKLIVAEEANPSPGERTIHVDPARAAAANLLGHMGILRVAVDNRVESRLVTLV